MQECHQIVSQRRLNLISPPGIPQLAIVGCGLSKRDPFPKPASIGKNLDLNVAMTLEMGPPYLKNLSTTFRLQTTNDVKDPNWLYEYHYDRRLHDDARGYPVPRCHLHVNAAPAGYKGLRPFGKLHLPTRRITLEQVVWHLVTDWGVKPLKKNWREILWRGEERFREIQKQRPYPYDLPFGREPADSDST